MTKTIYDLGLGQGIAVEEDDATGEGELVSIKSQGREYDSSGGQWYRAEVARRASQLAAARAEIERALSFQDGGDEMAVVEILRSLLDDLPATPAASDGGEAVPNRDGADGTDRLCQALYGRKARPGDYLGGSDARMLHDAADRVATPAASAWRSMSKHIDRVAWAILRTLHENVPEDKRPMSWSDVSSEQEERIKAAARAAVAAELQFILDESPPPASEPAPKQKEK